MDAALPTDDELRHGRTRTEDALTERKSSGDSGDWVKTIVGFANSVPFDRSGVLYIGVLDSGEIQSNPDLDNLQRTLRHKMDPVYPRIRYAARVLVEGDRTYLCVIVPGSPQRPHFAGPAYIRVGSETLVASESEHDRLVAQRSSKVYRLLQYKGQHLSARYVRDSAKVIEMQGRIFSQGIVEVVDCTAFSATLRDQYGAYHSIGLDRIQVLDDRPSGIFLEILDGL